MLYSYTCIDNTYNDHVAAWTQTDKSMSMANSTNSNRVWQTQQWQGIANHCQGGVGSNALYVVKYLAIYSTCHVTPRTAANSTRYGKHSKWQGDGRPNKWQGDGIPTNARVMAYPTNARVMADPG